MNNFLIIGFGLIGKERFDCLMSLKSNDDKFKCDIFDPNLDKNAFKDIQSHKRKKIFYTDNFENCKNKSYDLVIICTPHNISPFYAKLFLKKDINILVEKPLGRNMNELISIKECHNKSDIHIGFNYPYFACLKKLKSDLKKNKFGEIISLDLRIGHGNYPEARSSWKLSNDFCGGGVLLDPGIHMIDLLLDFYDDDIEIISAVSWRGFWNTGIEEEVKIISKIKDTIVTFDLSSLKWRSKFEIDINGVDAYGRITGRGRSYGKQVYTYGERWSWKNGKSQKDNEVIREKSDCSESFKNELNDILNGRKSNLDNTIKGMSIYEEIKDKLM